MTLTKRQQDILDFIKGCEVPPTFQEICTQFGMKSKNGAAQHVLVLQEKGFLRREFGKARGIRVVGQVKGWQPIETAPTKERIRIIGATTSIVVGDVFYGPASLLLAKMGDSEYLKERSVEAWRYTQGEDQVEPHMIPSHWQPLPQPPQGEKR